MKQINIVATVCLGGIGLALAYATDFYPFWATVAFVGVLGYMIFAPESQKKQPPAEPWYMK